MILSLFLFILILFIPLKLEIDYRQADFSQQMNVVIWVWLIPIKLSSPLIQWFSNKFFSASKKKSTKNISIIFQEIEKLHLNVSYSIGEAWLTGVANGLVWSGISMLYSSLKQSFSLLSRPAIKVIPTFSQASIEIRLHCIFRTRLGQIILRALQQQYQNIMDLFGKRKVKG